MNNKYEKESYIQPDPDINSSFWAGNITTILINQYSNIISGNVADFGCNHGLCVARASKLLNVAKVVGFDSFQESLDVAENVVMKQIDTHNKCTFINTNLTNILWENEYFDFAYSFHVLEHIFPEDIEQVMNEMNRVIKSNGYLLLNMPDKHSCPWEKKHVYHPNLSELDSLCNKHGFQKIESYEDERGGQVGLSKNITGLYKKFDI